MNLLHLMLTLMLVLAHGGKLGLVQDMSETQLAAHTLQADASPFASSALPEKKCQALPEYAPLIALSYNECDYDLKSKPVSDLMAQPSRSCCPYRLTSVGNNSPPRAG